MLGLLQMNGEGDNHVSGYIPNPNEEDDSENNGAMSGDDDQNGRRISTNPRHTAQQIQQLENFFKECPIPNENQKLELGRRLNLETKQVRFWFQNKRTQVKTKQERHENKCLRLEQEILQRDQELLRQAMILCSCNICGWPTNFGEVDFEMQRLTVENTRLNKEIQQFYRFLTTPIQLPVNPSEAQPSSSSNPGRHAGPDFYEGGGNSMTMNETSGLLDLAIAALNELIMLGEMNSPFWRKDTKSKRESLNYDEYMNVFNNGIKSPGCLMEATKASGLVFMTSFALVETLMDTNKWVNVFAPIVSVASSHEVLPTCPDGTRTGSLQMIQAEFQVISPLVAKRQVKFLRYCKKHRDGLWTVVDVTRRRQSPDLLSNDGSSRLPSGLIIEDVVNGYSKVTWIEHAEHDESHTHQIYQLLIGSGIGLGANRWLTTLQRHCESLSTLSSINLAKLYPGLSSKGATELVKLAQSMSLSYYSSITASSVYNWEIIPVENDGQNIRFMSRKMANEFDDQTGIVLSASTSVWLPVDQETLFNYLSNQNYRDQWDILTYNTSMEVRIHIEKAKRYGNYVSLLRIVENGMLVLQEIWNDASGALMVYAPVDKSSMEEVMRGGNSDSVKLLPSGFSILPDDNKNGERCLLTYGLQIWISKATTEITQNSVKTVQELMASILNKIKFALHIQT